MPKQPVKVATSDSTYYRSPGPDPTWESVSLVFETKYNASDVFPRGFYSVTGCMIDKFLGRDSRYKYSVEEGDC